MGIIVSEAAAQRARTFLASRGKGIGLRLGVKTTGCSGLAYVLEFVDELNPDDQVFEDNGVKIIVDGKSLVYLDGTHQGLRHWKIVKRLPRKIVKRLPHSTVIRPGIYCVEE